MEQTKNYTSKNFLQKKAIPAMNNLAYNEHTNTYFKYDKTFKLADNLQISNYIFKLLHFIVHDEIDPNLLVNQQIYNIIQGPTIKGVFYV